MSPVPAALVNTFVSADAYLKQGLRSHVYKEAELEYHASHGNHGRMADDNFITQNWPGPHCNQLHNA